MALKLGESLGQQVIVDKHGCADGNFGVEPAAKSSADGYTLLMAAFHKSKLHFNTLRMV